MPEQERVFTPSRTYDVQVKIKDLDYTNDLIKVTLGSSLSTAYQVVTLVISIDPNDVILEDVFGGEPIKLGITLHREQVYPGPKIDIELLYVSSDFQLTEKQQFSKETHKDRTNLTITTVARQPYITMNSFVNKVFIGTDLPSIVAELGAMAGAEIIYDGDGQNTTPIEQVCIPPTTLYKIIKEYNRHNEDHFDGFLDQRYGLFEGVPGVFCQYDNKVYIKNLTAKLKKDQAFTIYELAGFQDSEAMKMIIEEAMTGKTFYTYDSIHTDYSGNAKFAQIATTINNIVKPNDSITSIVPQNLESVAQDYSLVSSGQGIAPKLFIDPAIARTKYYNEDTGFNYDSIMFNSRYSRLISDMATISINIERNLPVLNLIQVGECVKFKPMTLEYVDLEGKYILWSSELNFERHGNWETTATVNLVRTNKKK